MTQNINDYTVCTVFSPTLASVLLVRKNRTAFKGMLNGVGGAVEPGETPYDGALREIQEETGLAPEDLKSLGMVRLAKLGELLVPEDCKTMDGSACRLHYYAGAVKAGAMSRIRPAGEKLFWTSFDEIANSGTQSLTIAGNGDLAYFAAAGRKALMQYLPGAYGPDGGAFSLKAALASAHARLDLSLRRRDMRQASLDAAEISRLAYAAYHDEQKKEREDDAGNKEKKTEGPIPTDGIL